MAKIVTFIKRNVQYEQEPGSPMRFSDFTIKQLVEIKRNLGAATAFFQVPESHAEQVLRKNLGYQEVDYDRISALAAKPRRKPRRTVVESSGEG